MKLFKIACSTVASASFLAISPTAFANTGHITKTSVANGAAAPNIFINNTNAANGHVPVHLLGSSETATHFYKKGVKHFENGNLEKSEAAFKAVLRAHGSESMDKLTLHYLTLINDKQGDHFAKEKYAQAYFELSKK
jgi:hypothetical protein